MVHNVASIYYPPVNLLFLLVLLNIPNCCFQTAVTCSPDVPVKYFA